MGENRPQPPTIHGRTAELQKEAAELGDTFLQYVYGVALLHLDEVTGTLGLLHEEPSVRSPTAQAWLKHLWPSFGRQERPQGRPLPSDAKCRSCLFWSGRDAPAGECRRYPPARSVILHGEVLSAAQPVWPATNADDWCGEWCGRMVTPTA